MSHESILALLDAEIDRLRQARALVSQATARAPRKVRISPAASATSTVPQDKPPLTPTELPGAARRGVSRVRKAATAVASRALGGIVPAGPVFVSAGQLRAMHTQAVLPGDPVVPLKTVTAEILAQRWLRPTTT